MVFFAPFIGAAAVLAGFASAAPAPDSSIGQEVAVSAPNGVIESATSSAYGSSSTGYSSGSSYGGSSGSSYGSSSGNSYGGYGSSSGSSMKDSSKDSMTSSSMMSESTSSKMMDSMMATSTAAAMSSYSTPSYGSGSSSSSNSGYSNCVQQCMASYPPPMATYMPSSTMNMTNSSSSGSGATHTVLVAPTQGVLRYVPFALNASVGDTVLFMWGANNHTVTKSSELTPCNKTTDGTAFASGTQNKPFSFTQVVNDTNTTFFYCGTPGHCQKGMFGIINPPNAAGAATSVSGMMSNMTSSSSDMAAMASYASMMTANSSQASSWGMNIDMASMPGWAQPLVAENVMYTQMFLAKNPDVLDASGNVNLAAGGSNPMMIPADVTSAVNNGGSSSSASTPAATTSASSSAASASGSASAAGAAAKSSGAGALASPSVLVGVVAVIATFFAL